MRIYPFCLKTVLAVIVCASRVMLDQSTCANVVRMCPEEALNGADWV